MDRLQGKSALVTGAASGIGAAIAVRLAQEGAAVTVADVAREEGEAVAHILERGRFQYLDVSDEAGWEGVVSDTVAAQGGLDILVNNAGIVMLSDITETSLEAWERIMRVNATGCFLGCRAAMSLMREKGGSIINMSSVAAMAGLPPYPAYSASKGAVRALTKSIAATCRDEGLSVRCNSVHPGAIDTPMTRGLRTIADPEVEANIVAGMGQPEDVAAIVAFLASDESKFINGAEMLVDGSLCMG